MPATPSYAPLGPASSLARWLLLAGLLLSVSFSFITRNTYDTGDSLMHYFIAQSVPAHPGNLLHAWGKPFYTLLATGPAQLGWQALLLWQCGLVAASAWLSYGVARRLGLPYAELAILFCYAAPDYFRVQFSGLTEPLFGLVLVASVYLAMAGRLGWSVGLVSWLPFVRSEGFILLGIWAVYLLWQRQWRLLPGLGLGYAVYSAIGAVVLGEPGWVFGRNPYPTISPYGHGDWSTYVVGLLYLLGWIIGVLVVVGAAAMLVQLAWRTAWAQPLFAAELLLVYGCVTVFIAAHTVFWRFGIFGSAGLTRVLTALTPLLAVVALRGLQTVASLAATPQRQHRIARAVAVATVLFSFTGLRMAFRWQRDFGENGDVTLARQVARWYRQLPGGQRPIATEQPAVIRALHLDRFNLQAAPRATLHGQSRLAQLPRGTLVFWDDNFSLVQEGLQLQTLQQNPSFRVRWTGRTLRQLGDPGGGYSRLLVFEKIR